MYILLVNTVSNLTSLFFFLLEKTPSEPSTGFLRLPVLLPETEVGGQSVKTDLTSTVKCIKTLPHFFHLSSLRTSVITNNACEV